METEPIRGETGSQRVSDQGGHQRPAVRTGGIVAPSSARADDTSFPCMLCQKSFKRPEHLRRHQKAHINDKAHTCSTCGKQFARSDVLVRHEFIHSASRKVEPRSAERPRACEECSRVRERCSRGDPCQRCSLRAISCQYRPMARNRSLSTNLRERRKGQRVSDLDSSAVAPMRELESGSDVEDVRVPNTLANNISAPFLTPNSNEDMALSMNWLPISDMEDMQWTSIFELGMLHDPSLVDHGGGLGPQVFSPSSLALANTGDGEHPGRAGDGSNPHGPGPGPASWLPPSTPSSSVRSALTSRSSGRSQQGNLYATSSSARTPASKRDKSPLPHIPGTCPQIALSKLAKPQDATSSSMHNDRTSSARAKVRNLPQEQNQDEGSARSIWPSTYALLISQFTRLCMQCEDDDRLACSEEEFPTCSQFNLFIRLFYSRFLPSLPILHETLSDANEYWILTLAIGAIGCQYTKTQEFDSLVPLLHEFLRRALKTTQITQQEPHVQILYIQALLLSQIGLYYYGPSTMRAHAVARRGYLIHCADATGLFGPISSPSSNHVGRTRPDLTSRWHAWVREEIKRRLGYSIWMLDIMAFYHFGIAPYLPHQVPQAELPNDGVWTAPNERDWLDMMERTKRIPTMKSAIRSIFQDKHVKADIGEFSRVLLLHGVYHELHQVRAYFQRPMSTWIPGSTAQYQSQPRGVEEVDVTTPESGSCVTDTTPWLSETQTFSAWRSAALDCVDVLHWWANGMIAMQSGIEHPTVAHLHFSRTVLLVPVRDILLLITSATNQQSSYEHRPAAMAQVLEAEREVIRWAQQDESKARLAAIHCGCVFWHLRRFSHMAFYESQSIFLATLALWAYSYYVSRPSPTQEAAEPSVGNVADDLSDASDSDSCTADPTFIWLDRPNDDEMVQCFVRSGRPDRMKAYVSGVGNIYEPNGPSKILKAGMRVLDTVSYAWGRDVRNMELLQQAARFREDTGQREG